MISSVQTSTHQRNIADKTVSKSVTPGRQLAALGYMSRGAGEGSRDPERMRHARERHPAWVCHTLVPLELSLMDNPEQG